MKAWRIQKFAGDVVYDLRSRGLLPLAILLVVAMVGVPLYISQSSGESGLPPAVVPGPSAAELAPENQSAVVAYEPGVRNYKERLDDRAEKDPFIQQFAGGSQATDALSAAAAAASPTGSGAGSVPSLDAGGTVPSSGGGGGGGGGGIVWRRVTFQTDVAIGESGSPLKRHNDLKTFAYLPSQAAPVLSYMGTLGEGERAVFLVSEDVVGQSGPGGCFPGPEQCQLLSLKPGRVQELVFGPANTVYRVKVLAIDRKVKIFRDEPGS